MKTYKTITKNIIKDLNLSTVENYGSTEVDIFIQSAKRYIKAIKQGRVICNIESVSASGMSRTIKFLECNGSTKKGFNYLNFYQFFTQLGFTKVKNSNTFRINGCGMDMVFHTNYTIMHQLCRYGFITKKECANLAQKTPSII